jgi:hypothetical protein
MVIKLNNSQDAVLKKHLDYFSPNTSQHLRTDGPNEVTETV